MKNNIENGIYIPEEQRNLIPVDEWVKREDPTTAQTVVLVTDFGMLEIAKEMYDARFRVLDEAFKKIGGEPATTIGWTSEADPDPEYSSHSAFIYYGSTGSGSPCGIRRQLSVRPRN